MPTNLGVRITVVLVLLLVAAWTTIELCAKLEHVQLVAPFTASEHETEAPDFVLDYAPYVYLHSSETFLPGHIGEHLEHVLPRLNYTRIYNHYPNLTNLAELNAHPNHGRDVYLTSQDDPSFPPSWLRGDANKPLSSANESYPVGRSSAPAVIIWTRKPGGVVDAFYFYFYSFNQGNTVATVRFGNHVGDWEHTVLRFRNGKPESMFFSQHERGAAYDYGAVEKIGQRPVTYSATGSHANYATPGTHYYAIPFHLLSDSADAGTLWDPAAHNYLYHYALDTDTLTPDVKRNPDAPTEWFHFKGRWGDRAYPADDERQYQVIGQLHWVSGPTGPRFKNLDRVGVCQNEDACDVWANRFIDGSGFPVELPDGEKNPVDDWSELVAQPVNDEI